MPDADDIWEALRHQSAQVDRLIDVIDGPTYTRIDGTTGRNRDDGLVAVVAALAGNVQSLTAASKQPTRIYVPPWAVTLIVAFIGAVATIAAATIQTLRAVQ